MLSHLVIVHCYAQYNLKLMDEVSLNKSFVLLVKLCYELECQVIKKPPHTHTLLVRCTVQKVLTLPTHLISS